MRDGHSLPDSCPPPLRLLFPEAVVVHDESTAPPSKRQVIQDLEQHLVRVTVTQVHSPHEEKEVRDTDSYCQRNAVME